MDRVFSASQHRPMNLLINALKIAIDDLAKAKGLKNARVDYKVNRRGELVVALIIPPSRPGEWTR
jgi:hypothetical protein